MGVKCDDPYEAVKKEKIEKDVALNVKEVIKPVIKSCDDSIEMESDRMKISCLESCPIILADVKHTTGLNFTMTSKVCVAAQVYYKGKVEAKHKDFGIVRIKNEEVIDGETPPFLFTFDGSIVKEEKVYKANEEVDVLDQAKCFIRAKVVSQEGDSVKINYNQEVKSYIKGDVFGCGMRLPFTKCAGTQTKPIQVKFCPSPAKKILKEKNIGDYIYDDGAKAKKHKVF